MDKKLSLADELEKKALRLYVNAALMMCRLKKPMKRAVRLVLIEKVKPRKAAEAVDRPRQHVYRALAVVKPLLDQVRSFKP